MDAPEIPARLIVENGPQEGTVVALTRERPCHIGTAPDSELRLDVPGIAARHLVVKALKDAGFGVRSLDGPLVLNGRASAAARLKHGDVLEIGGARLRYSELADAEAKASGAGSAPTTLGGFRLLRVLGAGGMGTVHEAEQVSLHREVALKILHKDLTRDPVFVARFVAEARAAARLQHPNVVQVFDVGHDGDTFFYSMELMHRGSLERLLKEHGKLDVPQALALLADAARGLGFAESQRIVHRDIKPDNLMLDQHGHVKIADLGLAMTDEDNVSKVVGTPHFMSPEQALGKPLDHRSDLYSLGCTFYRLLTGRTPFRRDSIKEILRAHVKDVPEPVHKVDASVPPEVSAIADRLLAKDPAERYQSAAELLAHIESVTAPRARRGVLIGGIAGAIVIAGCALAWGLTRPEGKTETITIKERDPRVAGLLETMRQKDAELARMRVLLAGDEPLARADALERVADDHPDTDAAAQARADAAQLRDQHDRAVAEREARAAAAATAADELRTAVRAVLAEGDYRRALLTLGDELPAAARAHGDAPVVRESIAELDAEVRAHAARVLAERRRAIDDARGSRDPDALAGAITALEKVADPETGWPTALVPEPTELRSFVAASREALGELHAALTAESVAALWQRYRSAMLGERGVVAAVDAFDFDTAAAAAERAAGGLHDGEAGQRAALLAESLRRASAYLDRFARAAGAGELTYAPNAPDSIGVSVGEDGEVPVVGFAARGEQPGLSVKVGPVIRPRTQLIPLGSLRGSELDAAFSLGDGSDDVERAAFLGWIALADHLTRSRAYLHQVAADDPESGTGPQAYGGEVAVLGAAADALQRCGAPWAKVLGEELAAGQLLVRALRAFSTHHNLAAANHLDRLREAHAHSLVVGALDP